MEKHFTSGGSSFRLSVPHLDIDAGAALAFVGESGAGKSTLLELLAMVLRPASSEALTFRPHADADSHDLAALWGAGASDRLTTLRSRHVGYVLQHGGLLPYLTVRENIRLAPQLLRRPVHEVAERWASRLGITQQLDKLPGTLSVGQRQRAAIARALAHDPAVLIADEPTAALDPLNAERIMALMAGLVDELGVTLIVASHALGLVRRAGLQLIEHRIEVLDEHSMHVTVCRAAG